MDRLARRNAAIDLSSGSSGSLDPWPGNGFADVARRGAGPSSGESDSARMRWLARTIEAEIIPRLMLAHSGPSGPHHRVEAGAGRSASPSEAEVVHFAALALDDDAGRSISYVTSLRNEGMALDVIYMELLAPAARRLGFLWETDQCDFTQVTLGLWRIQQAMYDLSPSFHRTDAAPGSRRAMLAPLPGSQHTFGLLMVSEFFQRAGWDVWARTSTTGEELATAAGGEWFDLCGLSIGSECHVAEAASVILDLRARSRNHGILIMVGGPILAARPDIPELIGADAAAADAACAVAEAERRVVARERFC